MKALSDFLDMGGYAVYLWPSYILTFAVVVLNIVWARRLLARAREEARRRLAMKTGTEAGAAPTRIDGERANASADGRDVYVARDEPEGASLDRRRAGDARAGGEVT